MVGTRLVAGFVLALLVTAVPLAAVAQDDPAGLEGDGWALVSYASDGGLVEVPADVDASLLLQDGELGGSGGCNVMFGSYALDGSSISFGPVGSTQMFCEGDAQVVEDAYLSALSTVASWSIEDGRLLLSDADGTTVLTFEPAAADPQADLDRIIALLTDLQAQVGALEERVAALEDETPGAGDGSSAGDGSDGDQASTSAPQAPRARGRVQTVFPDYLRDPFTPPDQVEDPNQEVVRWRDRSDDEAGFVVFARRGWCVLREGVDPNQPLDREDFRLTRGPAVRVTRLPADTERYRPPHLEIDAALPEKPIQRYSNDEFYDLYVAAVNEAGQSSRVKVASFFLTPEFNCP